MSSDKGSKKSEKAALAPNEAIVRELTYIFEPLAKAVREADKGNTKPLVELLEDVGVENAVQHASKGPLYDSIVGCVEFANGVVAVIEAVAKYDSFLKAVLSEPRLIGEGLQGVIGIVKMLVTIDDLDTATVDTDALGEAFLDTLIVKYLRKHQPVMFYLARVAGFVVEREDKHDEVKLEEIGRIMQDPASLPAEVFGWGTDELKTMVILKYLAVFFREFEIPLPGADYKLDLPAKIEPATDLDPAGNARKQLDVPLARHNSDHVLAGTGLEIVPMPGTDDGKLPGLAVVPYGKAVARDTWELGGQWRFHAEGMGAFEHWGPVIRPETPVEFRSIGDQTKDVPGEIHGAAEILYGDRITEGKPSRTTLIGDPERSRLAVSRVSLYTKVDYDGEEMVFTVGLPAKGTIGVHPKDFDGFLSKVMPEDGLFYDFDATLAWSSKRGLYLEQADTTEAAIPTKASLGPVTLNEIYLAAEPPELNLGAGDSTSGGGGGGSGDEQVVEGTITLVGAASATVTLGPVTATVRRMGVEADISFPEDKDGNLGFVDMEMGFKPPSGAGISFEAGPISGGGYLEFDPENERYAGVLQLKVRKLTINAVGLLTTELPGGKDGFSLLLIISGEFPPVQLGMGFTLNGVGGLIGVNRSVKSKPLGNAVRSGSMGSIMFPEDPVANAQRIISDLRSIFPPTDGVHAVGPLAKLGYGGGSMVTIDVGVVLSIPTWKVVLLGKVSTALPSKKKGQIKLNMAVSGVLDIPNKRAAMDATLYDSKLVMWTLSGDMAMRTRWGDDPRFVMSVGGWNPRFEPPSDFPALDRMRASMGEKGDNFRMELKGYLAVTSNTFQVGWSVFGKAEVGPASVKGKFDFDALFEFNPFKFVVDFLASFTVKTPVANASVELDGTFMGPGPFRIQGTMSYDIMGVSQKVQINATFGSPKGSEEMPRARILPKLTQELGKPVNWRAQLPADGPQLVTFRDVESGENEVLAHPMGEVGVRQTVVPLGFDVEKFGKATPSGYTTFTIESVTVGGSTALSLEDTTTEQFAPAKYRKMSDAEKLNSPAFEPHTAGRKMTHEGVYCGYASGTKSKNVRSGSFEYECTVVDRSQDNWATDLSRLGRFGAEGLDSTSALPAEVGASLVNVSASAQSPVRQGGDGRFQLSEVDRQAADAQAAGLASEIDIPESGSDSPGDRQVVRGGQDPDVGGLSGTVSMDQPEYTIATASDLEEVAVPGADGQMTKSQAQRELAKARKKRPEAAKQLRVVEAHRVQSTGGTQVATDGGEES
ncbi:MAG: hypothetical protein ACI91T_001846 [Natronomonas sp.]|jgi:hypothetical protein